ncbi:MAG: TauD/TfdA family dioxygenase [Myxococcales bacterium]
MIASSVSKLPRVPVRPRVSLPEGPVLVSGAGRHQRLADHVAKHGDELRQTLQMAGAILLRDFPQVDASEFAEVASTIGGPLGASYEGPSPRTYQAPGVYTASEVSSAVVVPEHAEMSYLPRMPRQLFFWCRRASRTGGETTLVDGRRVLSRLDPGLVEPLLAGPLRIRRRHARADGWHDPFELKRWNITFGTRDREELLARLRRLGTSAYFGHDGSLTLEQQQTAVRLHPETRERAWLNHLLVFHASTPAEILASAAHRERGLRALALRPLALGYRRAFQWLGREVATDVRLASGAPIADAIVNHVRQVVDASAIRVCWRPGDVLLVDNHLMLHGRRPFQGAREVLVSWSEASA